MSSKDLAAALDALESGGLKPGPDLDAAHEICQRHEGEPLLDWAHALVHRVEGDDANAGYWFRRAGKPRGASADEDLAAIRRALKAE